MKQPQIVHHSGSHRVGSWLFGCKQLCERGDYNPITDWTARDQSNKTVCATCVTCAISYNITYKLCTLVYMSLVPFWLPAAPHRCEKVVGTAKHALLLTSTFSPSKALILPFKENNARSQPDLSSHVFCHERRQSKRKVMVMILFCWLIHV